MKVKCAKSSGFCFGVKHAVETAQDIIKNKASGNTEALVMLGELTHNENVVKELTDGGFVIIDRAEDVPADSLVLIRAHGVPPQQMRILKEKNCNVIDCTCPFVAKIHKIVREQACAGKNVIISGGKGHPEVVGILGEALDEGVEAEVVSSVEDLKALKFPVSQSILISQTTFSKEVFKKICANVENKIANNSVFDTICYTTESRQSEAYDLAGESDAMIVIGSSHSSNTTKLYDICKSRCDRTYLINNVDDVEDLISQGKLNSDDVVGVTAGASTPEAIILEVVQKMNENENKNQEMTDINFGDYIESIPQIRRGAVVEGAITSADADYVYVDVHDKSEGKVPVKEFASDPDFDLNKAIEEHKVIEVVVKSIRNSDQGKEIILSKSQLDAEKNKGILEEAYNNKTPIDVKITHTVKDGIIGTYNGIDIYIHRTQIKFGTVENLDEYIGQTLTVRITKFDTEKHRLRISGSHRIMESEERQAKANEVWDNIEVGKKYKGIVRSLPDFGAFIDIGGVDGLAHITELSWKRIRKPSEVLSIGQEVEVYVKDFDKETKKISLGYKKEEDDPFFNVESELPVGTVINGTVVRLTDFGAFINIVPDLDALCHVSQISSKRLNKPSDVLKVGDQVTAEVIGIDTEKKRISVSIKKVAPIDPPEDEEYEDAVDEAAPEVAEEIPAAVEEAPAAVEEAAPAAEEAAPAEE
ncbi:MAG: bifunctional 4-hydroxy-3-methylbut-2-enyl diphosphate reductase/30S ribosomal protein S1 [Clostridiales bacterium]|nr:bifunctional 4-hydroxy-3-methylbut-2-enyl diphosphate reductase/30S ribosomal protein S1 [Clostridiales bacterium]